MDIRSVKEESEFFPSLWEDCGMCHPSWMNPENAYLDRNRRIPRRIYAASVGHGTGGPTPTCLDDVIIRSVPVPMTFEDHVREARKLLEIWDEANGR